MVAVAVEEGEDGVTAVIAWPAHTRTTTEKSDRKSGAVAVAGGASSTPDNPVREPIRMPQYGHATASANNHAHCALL